ncbi:MAG: acyl-CoA dehydrogenase family protein, partial [Acidimicrobiales bacterium]
MFEWSEEQQMVRDAIRQFIDKEVKPHLTELEHGDMPPYDILRKLFSTFGMADMARERFARQVAREEPVAAGEPAEERPSGGGGADAMAAAFTMIPIIE